MMLKMNLNFHLNRVLYVIVLHIFMIESLRSSLPRLTINQSINQSTTYLLSRSELGTFGMYTHNPNRLISISTVGALEIYRKSA